MGQSSPTGSDLKLQSASTHRKYLLNRTLLSLRPRDSGSVGLGYGLRINKFLRLWVKGPHFQNQYYVNTRETSQGCDALPRTRNLSGRSKSRSVGRNLGMVNGSEKEPLRNWKRSIRLGAQRAMLGMFRDRYKR